MKLCVMECPERPVLRKRWFTELLAAGAALRATRTLNRRSPRMVKRRNSQYAPHDRQAPTRVPTDFTPTTVAPREPTRRTRPPRKDLHLWSAANPGGQFF